MDISYIINELGEDREDYFNAVSPPIMQTSNFAFPTVADFSEAFADELGTYIYSRARNPTVDILRKKLAALDGAEDALVFNNGAAAIAGGVMANVKAGDHIVSVNQPYTWAQRMFDVILSRFGVQTTYIDGSAIDNWKAATRDNTTFFYLESPNSWNFAIQPLEEVAAFAKSRGIVTLIDNSYCTPLYQRPIELGIDLAMQTATKYISGHSDTLGGVLSGNASMIKRIFESEVMTVGNGIQPFNAWLLIRGLRTMPARLERIAQTTEKVLEYILSHSMVERVLFPLHPSFPQYALARHQMKGGSGLFTMVLKATDRASIVRFCDNLQHIMMAVSWGGHESLIVPKCASIPANDFDAANPEHRYVRMYVGLESADYLIKDLEQAFATM